MTDPFALPYQLRSAREKCGFTIDYVARMIDVKPRNVKEWEDGDALPSDADLSLLSQLYGVDFSAAPHVTDGFHLPKEPDTHLSRKGQSSEKDVLQGTAVSGDLFENETILWTGAPDPNFDSAPMPAALTFGAVFTVAGIFIALVIIFASSEFAIGILDTLFLAPAAFWILYGLTFQHRRKKAVTYVITNYRVLCRTRKSCTVMLRYGPNFCVYFRPSEDGHGTILCNYSTPSAKEIPEPHEEPSFFFGRNDFRRTKQYITSISHYFKSLKNPKEHLVDLENADEVYRILTKAARSTQSHSKEFSKS